MVDIDMAHTIETLQNIVNMFEIKRLNIAHIANFDTTYQKQYQDFKSCLI